LQGHQIPTQFGRERFAVAAIDSYGINDGPLSAAAVLLPVLLERCALTQRTNPARALGGHRGIILHPCSSSPKPYFHRTTTHHGLFCPT